jgi:DNA-directed RNA polymerase sigma subunit (sigma70/sigma32)
MEDLSSREAQIIEMRFGLADGNPMTLEEIGKHFRVTRERIRQVSWDAISIMWRDFSRPFSKAYALTSSCSLLRYYRLFF